MTIASAIKPKLIQFQAKEADGNKKRDNYPSVTRGQHKVNGKTRIDANAKFTSARTPILRHDNHVWIFFSLSFMGFSFFEKESLT